MTYAIHVPQSHSARLEKKYVKFNDISSLYTDDFSTCKIIAIISETRLSLIHADDDVRMNIEIYFREELQWVGKQAKIFVLQVEDLNQNYKQKLIDIAAQEIPGQGIEFHTIPEGLNIYLSFNKDEANTIHPCIKLSEKKPEKMLFHPQHSQMMQVTKIQQALLFPEKHANRNALPRKQLYIFGGLAWQEMTSADVMLESENKVIDQRIKQIIHTYSSVKTYVVLRGHMLMEMTELMKNHEDIITFDEDAIEVSSTLTARYLEEYFNRDASAEALFRDGVSIFFSDTYFPEMVENSGKKLTKEELNLIKKLKNSTPEQARIILHELKSKLNDLETEDGLFEFIVDVFEATILHYNERKEMELQNKSYARSRKVAMSLNMLLASSISNEQRSENQRCEIAKEALQKFSCSSYESASLATFFYTYGKELMNAKQFVLAKEVLEITERLQTKYEENVSIRQKTVSALEKCNQEISQNDKSEINAVESLNISMK